MARSKGVNKTVRKHILLRDNHTCKKCGRRDLLDIHHIQAVMDGGSNEPENLITLCNVCHREWELAEMTLEVPFATWLPLPPYHVLFTSFLTKDAWSAPLSASDMHTNIMKFHETLREVRQSEL